MPPINVIAAIPVPPVKITNEDIAPDRELLLILFLSFRYAKGSESYCLILFHTSPDPSVGRKQEYQDAVDRIEVERCFSLAKRCYGLGLIRTKLDTTTRSSIVLSIIAMNVDRIQAFSFAEFLVSFFQGTGLDIWWCPGFNIGSGPMGA